MKPAGVLPQKFAIAATSETCIAYVGEGLGMTCMPWSAVQLSRPSAAIAVRPLGPHPVEVTWYVSSRSGEPPASRAAAVSRMLEGWARSPKCPRPPERSSSKGRRASPRRVAAPA